MKPWRHQPEYSSRLDRCWLVCWLRGGPEVRLTLRHLSFLRLGSFGALWSEFVDKKDLLEHHGSGLEYRIVTVLREKSRTACASGSP